MHRPHSNREAGVCLAEDRHSKNRLAARELRQSPSLSNQAVAATLPQFQRNYAAKNRELTEEIEMHWPPVQGTNYAIQEQSGVYQREGSWSMQPEGRVQECPHSSNRRHIDGYSSSVARSNYQIENNPVLPGHRQYEANVTLCASSGHSHSFADENYSSFSEEETPTQNDSSGNIKSSRKFAWMKNTKSHHIEWKTQWERGKSFSFTDQML